MKKSIKNFKSLGFDVAFVSLLMMGAAIGTSLVCLLIMAGGSPG
jgi:hypothetical protein